MTLKLRTTGERKLSYPSFGYPTTHLEHQCSGTVVTLDLSVVPLVDYASMTKENCDNVILRYIW